MVDVSQLKLPKGGSVTAPVKSSIKDQLQNTIAYNPWDQSGYGNGYSSWFRWMQDRSFQTPIWNMKAVDAEQLYQIMSQVCWDCHNNHTLLKEKQG